MMDAILHEPNPRAVIGGNNPPEPTPYERAEKAITDLYGEATLWLDGAPIDSQDLADGVSDLKASIQKARKAADEARDAEKRPFLEAGREVDARYKPLLSKADMAMEACKKALKSWLDKVAAEIEAKAKAAREEAEAKRLAAQEKLRAADAANLAAREKAEQAIADAKQAEREAAKAEKAKPNAGGAVGRRDGLTTVYRAELVDPVAALKHYCRVAPAAVREFLQGLADSHVRFGDHAPDEIPGFTIHSETKVR